MIKYVLFDLDETLFDRTQTLRAFLKDQFNRFRAQLGTVDRHQWVDWFIRTDDRGKLSKREVYPAILAEFGGEAALFETLLADYYENSVANAVPMPGMKRLLDDLKSRKIKVAIITNGETVLQTQTLTILGLDLGVEFTLISQAQGCRKPEREIFDRALARLGADPEASLFVGDDPISDILGAHAAGLKTAWFNPDKRAWPHSISSNPGAEISGLVGVLQLLE